mgnify:CR=1 FL=1
MPTKYMMMCFYDAVNKQIIDAGQESYSSTFFKAQKGNKVLTDVNELKFKDGRNIGVNYMPDAGSPCVDGRFI